LLRDGEALEGDVVAPRVPHFGGKTYVLISAVNSSATFEFARAIKQTRLATLVGQTTGGNLRGINGGAFFFVRLPHSKIELDLPLVAQFPQEAQPDAGVTPDIAVSPTVEDLVAGRDAELEAVLHDIATRETAGHPTE
jgi:C-terminal processing protease CtpA/Prc